MASWPSTLPGWSYPKDSPTDVYIHSATDVGPGKMRRRYSAQGRSLSFQFFITGAQRATMDTFYNDNPTFTHEDPSDGVVATFRWEGSPDYQMRAGAGNAADRIWQVTIKLTRMP